MPPWLRKLGVTVHVVVSIGWLGAVCVFLVLSILALTTDDPAAVRGAYLLMDPAARLVLVPLALAALASGVIQSLGTRWGLIRHYWVVVKLVLTTLGTGILIAYLRTFRSMAAVAADAAADLTTVRNPSPAIHAALAAILLLVATVLGIYKPRGLTRRGWRIEEERRLSR